jgi:hypothetical protein
MMLLLLVFSFAMAVLALAGRVYLRWSGRPGLTWEVGPEVFTFLAFKTHCTHYLTPHEYWDLIWRHGYCAQSDPDPVPFLNIPMIVLDFLLYACFTTIVMPVFYGAPPMCYAFVMKGRPIDDTTGEAMFNIRARSAYYPTC